MDTETQNNPQYTYYEEVYKLFLGSVDSYEMNMMDDDELEERLYDYMDRGRIILETNSSIDFYDDNPAEKRFNFKLKGYEKTLLAKAMKLEWVREQTYSEELMRKSIGDRDYNATQGYQYLDRLLTMGKQLEKEIIMNLNRIEYSNQELYGEMK